MALNIYLACAFLKSYGKYEYATKPRDASISTDTEDASLLNLRCFVFQEERKENKVEGQHSSAFVVLPVCLSSLECHL
jgi:hypothetical protein